jgi:TRAP-type transport system periplasmic protein
MKITRWVAACALTLSTTLGFAGPSWAETILQLGHPTASTSHYGVAAATLADELAKRSNSAR